MSITFFSSSSSYRQFSNKEFCWSFLIIAAQNQRQSAADKAPSASRHIALIITALGPGGAERVMTSMANHWIREGHYVSILTYEQPAADSYYDLDQRIKVIRLDLEDYPSSTMQGIWQTGRRILALRRALRELHPNIAIAFLTRVNIATVLAATGQRVPVIVSERNHPDRQHLNWFWRWLRDRTYRKAASIVCQTDGARACYPPSLQEGAKVIANPLRPIRRAKAPLAKRELVAVGRLTKQKGFDLLLRAFADITDDHPSWTLTIWGEGTERPKLEFLCKKLGLADNVRLPGVTAGHGDWVDQAGLFVLSSRYEGLPNVLLEAMAAGLPVVAFDCPLGPADLIDHGQNGILVPPEDVPTLAKSLAALMSDETERARLARNAEGITKNYQLETIMAKWSRLLDETDPRK